MFCNFVFYFFVWKSGNKIAPSCLDVSVAEIRASTVVALVLDVTASMEVVRAYILNEHLQHLPNRSPDKAAAAKSG